jgi:predicted transglutaminase-like cysteine proteinase
MIMLVFGLGLVVADSLRLSETLLAHIQQKYGIAARQRVISWERVIDSSRVARSNREKLEQVNRFFNKLRFIDDSKHWGKRDYWATPVEFLSTNGGDCEDFSIAKYFTLLKAGVPRERLRLTYVKALKLNQAHMVLTYYETPGAEPLVLDNLIKDIRPASLRKDLLPVYSFNGEGLWLAKQRGSGQFVAKASRIHRWNDLMQRMDKIWAAEIK